MRKYVLVLTSLIVLTIFSGICSAEVPHLINFQGYLVDSANNPLNGDYEITFKIYNDSKGGDLVWSETNIIPVEQGLYSIVLGKQNPIKQKIEGDIWFAMQINGQPEMEPRYRSTSVLYSIMAENAKKLDGYEVSSTPEPGKIVPLGADGKLPSSVLPGIGLNNHKSLANSSKGNTPVKSIASSSGNPTPSTSGGNTQRGESFEEIIWNQQGGIPGKDDILDDECGWVRDGGNNTTRLYDIDDSVGIGTANPAVKLHVEGKLYVSDRAVVGLYNDNTGAYSFVAGVHDTISGTHGAVFGDSNYVSGNHSFCVGQENTVSGDYSSITGGGSNVASGFGTAIIGGGRNTADGDTSAVGGGSNNQASGTSSVIGGGFNNYIDTVATYGTIGGGISNHIIGDHGTVAGGYTNIIYPDADYSTIGGGSANYARSDYNSLAGGYSNLINSGANYGTIGGGKNGSVYAAYGGIASGYDNKAGNDSTDIAAFVGGGRDNAALGPYSAVLGGKDDTSSGQYSVVGGGSGNKATELNSTVSGGSSNKAYGQKSTVGGGYNNYATQLSSTISGGESNQSFGSLSTISGGVYNFIDSLALGGSIGGGYDNTIFALYGGVSAGHSNVAGDSSYADTAAYVGGGRENKATGIFSTVPGGRSNEAAGDYSFAAGRRAKADSAGCFVWGDATAADFSATAPNQFLIRASGGVGILTDTAYTDLHVSGDFLAGGNGIDGEITLMDSDDTTLFNVTADGNGHGRLTLYDADGDAIVELGEGLDYAESFPTTHDDIEAGTVMIIDPQNTGKLCMSNSGYDKRVAGIVAGANGINSGVRLGYTGSDGEYPIALAGRVYCKVDGKYGSIKPGDLLTTSPTPGHAMVVKDYFKAQGAIIGKAMEAMSSDGTGEVLVLITLQ